MLKLYRPLDDVIAINRVVEKGIKEAKALDTEALCIISGRKVVECGVCSSLPSQTVGMERKDRPSCS